MKANLIVPNKNVSILLKSPFGFGKTCAACSFAILGDVYLAYFDKAVPVELYSFFNKLGRKDLLDRIDFDSYSGKNPNEYINKLISLKREPGKYAAVVTDSITFLTDAAVNWSMSFRPSGGKKKSKASEADEFIPGFDDYKTETNLVSQALDLCKSLGCIVVWTGHPLSVIKVEGSGSSINVTKTTSLVSYGSKVGSIAPGAFNEIYHIGRQVNKRIVYTDAVGDDYAKTSLGMPMELDITNRLFAEVWKEELDKVLASHGEKREEEVQSSSFQAPQVTFPETKEGATRWKI
jgi:hypothetical protein